jgi:hypothetical protein
MGMATRDTVIRAVEAIVVAVVMYLVAPNLKTWIDVRLHGGRVINCDVNIAKYEEATKAAREARSAVEKHRNAKDFSDANVSEVLSAINKLEDAINVARPNC